MKQLIAMTSVCLGEVMFYDAGYVNFEKCAAVCFIGPQAWGIEMHIPLADVQSFINDKARVQNFIGFAKAKLGLEVNR